MYKLNPVDMNIEESWIKNGEVMIHLFWKDIILFKYVHCMNNGNKYIMMNNVNLLV